MWIALRYRLQLIAFIPLMLTAFVLAVLHYAWCIVAGRPTGTDIAVAFDRLGNTATNGNTGETVSSRAGRARRKGRAWGCVLCGLIDKIDPGHCERFIEQRYVQPDETTPYH